MTDTITHEVKRTPFQVEICPLQFYTVRATPRLVGSESSYKLSPQEIEALNVVKAATPKMDRNGYFSYVSSTAKKKKINLMQPRPPRMAFEEKRRPGVAERVDSTGANAVECRRVESMTQRVLTEAPRARLFTQLESYQPRYHTIRENSERKVESECKKRRNEQRKGHQQTVR
ncbi:unnamed protein product [Leptosia nina]|uniref:Uncharacterized protein n=1 Tax=Leptosia nina TaxID=320188 RepID=A0AAV1JKY2_9NEOP